MDGTVTRGRQNDDSRARDGLCKLDDSPFKAGRSCMRKGTFLRALKCNGKERLHKAKRAFEKPLVGWGKCRRATRLKQLCQEHASSNL